MTGNRGRAAGPGARFRHRAESLAGRLPPLLIAAERVATSVAQGVHGRRRVGQGEAFWQFRDYAPGDAPNSIDWRTSARTDRIYVREREWEAAQSLWLWVDDSPSMAWRSERSLPLKGERARLIAAAASILLIRAGERVGRIGTLAEGIPPARSSRAGLSELIERLAEESEDTAVDSAGTDRGEVPPDLPLPRFAQTLWIGDLLAPLEEIQGAIQAYVKRGVRGHMVQVLDPAEERLPYEGRIRFDSTAGRAGGPADWLISRVERVRGDYRSRLETHRAGLRHAAKAAGWSFQVHHTDQPPTPALLSLWARLSQREAA